jgi:hypothetical protein
MWLIPSGPPVVTVGSKGNHPDEGKMTMDDAPPLVLGVATYGSRDGAVRDFHTVWGARHQGEYDHTAVAVLTKDARGELNVDRHDSTAKHLAWGGALAVVARGQSQCRVGQNQHQRQWQCRRGSAAYAPSPDGRTPA